MVYFDENTSLDDFPEADIYAYSISASISYPVYRMVASKVKDKAKYHIAGNVQVNIFPEQVLDEMALDAVFRGAGEETIPNWISGGCKEKGIIEGGVIKDINGLIPARHLIDQKYIYMKGRVGGKSRNSISMISSRGCVYKCKFCAVQNRQRVVFRSLDDIEREVLYLLKKYPKCDGITLLDETFTLSKMHVKGVAEIMSRYGLKWECNARIDTVDKEMIDILRANMCAEIRFGIETGSQKLLDAMGKGYVLEKTYDVFRSLKEVGLQTKIYLMHGYPGENMETTNETIEFLEKMEECIDRISLYRFTPLPGSAVYDELFSDQQKWEEYSIYNDNLGWCEDESKKQEINEAYKKLEAVVAKMNKV